MWHWGHIAVTNQRWMRNTSSEIEAVTIKNEPLAQFSSSVSRFPWWDSFVADDLYVVFHLTLIRVGVPQDYKKYISEPIEFLPGSSHTLNSIWLLSPVVQNLLTLTEIGEHLDILFWGYMTLHTSSGTIVKPNFLDLVPKLLTQSSSHLAGPEFFILWPITRPTPFY